MPNEVQPPLAPLFMVPWATSSPRLRWRSPGLYSKKVGQFTLKLEFRRTELIWGLYTPRSLGCIWRALNATVRCIIAQPTPESGTRFAKECLRGWDGLCFGYGPQIGGRIAIRHLLKCMISLSGTWRRFLGRLMRPLSRKRSFLKGCGNGKGLQ